jgi:hypothetical protein
MSSHHLKIFTEIWIGKFFAGYLESFSTTQKEALAESHEEPWLEMIEHSLTKHELKTFMQEQGYTMTKVKETWEAGSSAPRIAQ